MPYSRKMRFWVVGLLLLAGCSSPGTSSAAEPGRPDPPTPVKAERYEAIDLLLADLGLGSDVASSGIGNNEGSLRDFVEIEVGDGVVDIYLFDTRRQRNAWLPQMVGVGDVVYGPNWIVVPFENTRVVFAALGGTVIAAP